MSKPSNTYSETLNVVQSDSAILSGRANIGENAKFSPAEAVAALTWVERIADLVRRLAESDGANGYGCGSARAVLAVAAEWLGEDARSGLAALGHDASDEAAQGDGSGIERAIDLAALGRAIGGIGATIDGLRRAAEGSTKCADAGEFDLVLRAIVPWHGKAAAAGRAMGAVEAGAGWTRDRLIAAAKAHADAYSAASLKNLVQQFGVKKAVEIDPVRWPEFYGRAAAGTPLAA